MYWSGKDHDSEVFRREPSVEALRVLDPTSLWPSLRSRQRCHSFRPAKSRPRQSLIPHVFHSGFVPRSRPDPGIFVEAIVSGARSNGGVDGIRLCHRSSGH